MVNASQQMLIAAFKGELIKLKSNRVDDASKIGGNIETTLEETKVMGEETELIGNDNDEDAAFKNVSEGERNEMKIDDSNKNKGKMIENEIENEVFITEVSDENVVVEKEKENEANMENLEGTNAVNGKVMERKVVAEEEVEVVKNVQGDFKSDDDVVKNVEEGFNSCEQKISSEEEVDLDKLVKNVVYDSTYDGFRI